MNQHVEYRFFFIISSNHMQLIHQSGGLSIIGSNWNNIIIVNIFTCCGGINLSDEVEAVLLLVNVFQPLVNVSNGMGSVVGMQLKRSEAREEFAYRMVTLPGEVASQAIVCKLLQQVLGIVCKLDVVEEGLKLDHLLFHTTNQTDLVNSE
ncbi:hypothetical protein Sjap_008078 [Stephania japonica]|uniref:Uncharacterized protein n=1 Tax=Stephania japonica TaxID=461633 RepID=A0AAP0PBY4_9MAGN